MFYKISTLVLCMAFAIIWCVPVCADADMPVYRISSDTLDEFMKNPSLDLLMSKNTQFKTYFKKDEGFVIKTTDEEIYKYQGWSCSIGDISIKHSFFDFVTNSNGEMQKFLSANGLGVFEHAIVIECGLVPVIIWAVTQSGSCYITAEADFTEYDEALFVDSDSVFYYGGYVFTLYTEEEFNSKYGLHPGQLLIVGDDLTQSNYVRFRNKTAYMPLRVLMENLQAEVIWNGDTKTVYIKKQEKEYVFDVLNSGLYEKNTELRPVLPPPGTTGYYEYKIIDDRVVINHNIATLLTESFGGVIEVDFAGRIINVMSKTR